MLTTIASLAAWILLNPTITTTIIAGVGIALAAWFIHAYWVWILAAFFLWAIPKVLEILREFGIDFRKTERLTRWMDGKSQEKPDILKDAFQTFKKGILRLGSTFTKNDSGTLLHKQEMLVDRGNDQGTLVTAEKEISWHDIPDKVRAEMIRQRIDSFTVNDHEVFDQRFKQRAEEEKMPELMEMVH